MSAAHAQTTPLSLKKAIELAKTNNRNLKNAGLEISLQERLGKGATEVKKAELAVDYGQLNSIEKGDNSFSISQTIPFPSLFSANRKLANTKVKSATQKFFITQNELVYSVKEIYTDLQRLYMQQTLLKKQDSIFVGFLKSAALRYKSGEGTLLERSTAQNELAEVQNKQRENESNLTVFYRKLNVLLFTQTNYVIAERNLSDGLLKLDLDTARLRLNPNLSYLNEQIAIANGEKKVEIAKSLPDIKLGYLNQSIIGTQNSSGQEVYFGGGDRFQGVQVGLTIPLFYGFHRSKIKAADIQAKIASEKLLNYKLELDGEYQQTLQEYLQQKKTLEYYNNSALPNMTAIDKTSQLSFQGGEISYQNYLLNLYNTTSMSNNYINALYEFVQTKNKLEFLIGNAAN